MPNQNPVVLLVVAEPLLAEITEFRLELLGFHVRTIAEANAAQVVISDGLPDLIILDAYLTEKEDLDLVERMSNDTRTSDIPLLLLSTDSDLEAVERAYQAGADDYLVIPYDPSVLEAKIETMLSERQLEKSKA